MADLSDTIETAAGEPKKAAGDQGSAEQHPLPDLIAADQYLAGKDAVAGTGENGGPVSPFNCLRPARFRPGGPV